MSFVEWNEDLFLGIRQIDEHHQHLVDLLNKCHDALLWGIRPGERTLLVTSLKEYALYHFATEEGLMKAHDYPELEAHLGEHGIFNATIVSLDDSSPLHDDQGYLDIMTFLLEWFVIHIKSVDRKLCAYLAAQGLT